MVTVVSVTFRMLMLRGASGTEKTDRGGWMNSGPAAAVATNANAHIQHITFVIFHLVTPNVVIPHHKPRPVPEQEKKKYISQPRRPSPTSV